MSKNFSKITKALTDYTRDQLRQIAKTFGIPLRRIIEERLNKSDLIEKIKENPDYQKQTQISRIEVLKNNIKGIRDPEDIMIEIISIFKDLEFIPTPGNYYTFIYKAKTPKIKYDQHPLIAALEVKQWGFSGLNFHWQDVDPKQAVRNYTWNEVNGQLYTVYDDEIDYMKSVSSRIMAGLCIKGGTGLCNLVLDNELLENSEYTIDIGQLYKKTYEDITIQEKQDVDSDIFIPEL
jgi:hypothetical protein